ncbi:MAG: chemotaxis protein CheD [Gemmatimonadota bacterium]|nr:chemotaxis protein CheD [Gemmatimonadota bacterium]MDE3173786.1 chemotaxis protein CheD [Gemmatimonadota bacterium]
MSDKRVGIAELAVGAGEGTLSTIALGSCVAIVLYDAVARVGGLAHVLLPEPERPANGDNPARYPGTALPALVERMTALGAARARIGARLVGGASMFAALLPKDAVTVGSRNVAASRQALAAAGIPLVAEDVGLDHGRSVYFHLADGRVEVRSLARGTRVL